jgi:hypothetical protein
MLVYWVVSIIVLAIGRTTRPTASRKPRRLSRGNGSQGKGTEQLPRVGRGRWTALPRRFPRCPPRRGESDRHEPRGAADMILPALGPGANGSLTVGVVLSPRSIGQRMSNDE